MSCTVSEGPGCRRAHSSARRGSVVLELVTLLVTREDALVLKYLHEMGADLIWRCVLPD